MVERIVVLGGKGGVGKSSISAATAVSLSDLLPEKKILVISFDIAHNLSDLFQKQIGERLTKLTNNLWGIEPDPDIYAKEYTEEFAKKMRKLIKKMPIVGMIPQIKTFVDTTFTSDSIPLALKNAMFFQKLLDAEDRLYREGTEEVDFDIIVADFPPTGNMVALFEIPEDQVKVVLKYSLNFYNSIKHALHGVSNVIRKMTRPFESAGDKAHLGDEIVKMLNQLEERGERISDLIHDVGSLRLVTIAEKPSFEEIKRARDLTEKYINLDGVHINMLTPKSDNCDFCNNVRSTQQKYLREIKNEFKNRRIWESEKLREEPIGLDGLRKLAKEIYGETSAQDILYPK
ncbi:MAG: AAA family ATPase [Candidatus Lokiarchaeota archaeon]|nr:AAA family ATPase [Candidatus Lokiarchaeota archaeon]MBD3340155.1 AAA family ATPase [Candidatus Lokiarchaeota archaeon]